MKKYNTFKVIGIVIIITMLLSYFIPQTTVGYGEVTKGGLNPVGVIDTFSNFITSFNVFVSPVIFILVLGVFYKILSKTGKYEEVVENTAIKFSNNKGLFAVLSVLFFGIFTAIIGDILPMLIFVPLFMAIAIKLGYKKTAAVASTIGAILIGSAGSLNTSIMNQILYTTVETNVLYKILIILIGLVSLIAFILVFNRTEKVEINAENKKLYPSAWLILGYLIPIVGLILFLVWNKKKKSEAIFAGVGAITGFIINIISTVVTILFGYAYALPISIIALVILLAVEICLSIEPINASKDEVKKTSSAWLILGYAIPVVGLILFLVWNKNKKEAAKYVGIGAIVGFVVNVVSTVVTILFGYGFALPISIIALIIVLAIGIGSSNLLSKRFPIALIMFLTFIFVVLGMTPWSTYFKFTGFETLFQNITDFKVADVSLYKSFVATTVSAWGNWQLFDITVLLGIVSVILVIIYRIKFDEFLELSAKAIKRSLPYALIIVFANTVLVSVYSSGWFYTLITALLGKKFNMFAGALMSALSSIVYSDYLYGVQFSLSTIVYSLKSNDFYKILQLVYQSIYSIFLLISPTSILLLLGLYHLNISFKEWIKYIWKYFLILLATMLIILSIVAYGFSIPIILSIMILFVIIVLLVINQVSKVQKEMIKNANKVEKKEIKKEEVKQEKKDNKKTSKNTKNKKKK